MRKRKYIIGAVVGVVGLAVAAVAMASSQFIQTAVLKFRTTHPNASTGVTLNFNASDPGEPGGRPKASKKAVLQLAKGSKVDNKAAKQCNKSDSDVIAGKCPAGSRIGTGSATAITGFGPPIDPVPETIIAYNARAQIILLLRPQGAIGQTLVIRGKVKNTTRGAKITAIVPPLPVPNRPNASLGKFQVNVKAESRGSGANRHRLIQTPKTCPRSRNWLNTVRFTYEDGTTAKINTRSRCRKS